MTVFSDTKIYVLCPSGRRSETADNCHWLCSQLIRLGVEAYMVYLPGGGENISVDDFYLRYNLPYDTGVEDSAKNIVIVPEVAATYLYLTKQTRRVLWWFDVDNFFRDMGARLVKQFDNILTQPMPKFFTFSHFDGDIEHWAQSEYARQFLKVNGVPDEKVFTVSDSLNKNFLDYAAKIDTAAKKNLVAYKPVPNRDFTDVVKNLANGVEWRAVEDLTAAALQKLFAEAKVYVDFSDHGAKDKLTREAAVSGCVVITGKRGAAGNDVDLNIPAEFKFNETVDAALAAAEKIGDALENFDAEYAKQTDFREKILRETDSSLEEIAAALGVAVPEKIAVGIVHGIDDIGADVAEILFANDSELYPAFIIDDDPDNSAASIIHEQNRSFLNLDSGRRLEIISSADANFLYGVGRIQKFLRTSNEAEEIEFVRENLNPADGDVIELDFEVKNND